MAGRWRKTKRGGSRVDGKGPRLGPASVMPPGSTVPGDLGRTPHWSAAGRASSSPEGAGLRKEPSLIGSVSRRSSPRSCRGQEREDRPTPGRANNRGGDACSLKTESVKGACLSAHSVMPGLDPGIHDEIPQAEAILMQFAAKPHGLPGHKGVHARLRRAMPGNDSREASGRVVLNAPSACPRRPRAG